MASGDSRRDGAAPFLGGRQFRQALRSEQGAEIEADVLGVFRQGLSKGFEGGHSCALKRAGRLGRPAGEEKSRRASWPAVIGTDRTILGNGLQLIRSLLPVRNQAHRARMGWLRTRPVLGAASSRRATPFCHDDALSGWRPVSACAESAPCAYSAPALAPRRAVATMEEVAGSSGIGNASVPLSPSAANRRSAWPSRS